MKFNRWTALRFDASRKGRNHFWICRCDCGRVKSVAISGIKNGGSKGCGCIGNRKHGLTGSYIYKTWDLMKQRCYWTRHKNYNQYGGRGIMMCSFIRASPRNLLTVVGHKASNQFSIDRKNNDAHYSCGSCEECFRNGWDMNLRWATSKQQARNRTNTLVATIDGISHTVTEWAEHCGLNYQTIYCRIQRGETGNALISPLHERQKFSLTSEERH